MFDSAVRFVAAIACIFLALGLGRFVNRQLGGQWNTYRLGCFCFLASQVVHVPFNAVVLQVIFGFDQSAIENAHGIQLASLAVFLGLSAGFCEETARWLLYKYRFSTLDFTSAVMFGAGHGGCEAMIIGVMGIAQLIGMSMLRDFPPDDAPDNEAAAIDKAVSAYWDASPVVVMLGPLERAWALVLHCCLSVLVLQSFVHSSWYGYGLAVALHAAVDMFAVVLMRIAGPVSLEMLLGLTVLPLSIWILRRFYNQSGSAVESQRLVATGTN